MSRAGILAVVLFSCLVTRTVAATTLAVPCAASATTLCLNNQRFRLEVQWTDFDGKSGIGTAIPLTADTGYFWFFNNTNVELIVKVLDARAVNGKFWVFYGALSNVQYTMTVTDTETGTVKVYFNPSGRFASVGDTAAFTGGQDSPARTTQDRRTEVQPAPLQTITASAVGACVSTETSLCLSGGRFRAEVNWTDFSGNRGVGRAVPLTAETGYFWFFNSSNVELVVKALDARALNGRFWIFYGALSNVEYELKVTDTLTGNVNSYSNPSGRFASAGDTNGFRAGYAVATRLDEDRAVSGDVPTSGGTISAAAADGTVFTLTIPPDALLSEERITLTPVAAIDRLPLSGGLSAAVDLAPAGLRLFKLATLQITPGTAISLAEQTTFAWRGNGEEFFLYPPELDKQRISMKLMHFSGYGVGRGTPADQTAQQRRIPGSPEDGLSQRLQPLFANRRLTQSTGLAALDAQGDFFDKVGAELRAYYDSVLAAELATAKTDCAKAKAILQRALSWSRQVQLLGFDSDPVFAANVETIMSALIESLVNCYNESFDTCVEKNDPAQVTQLLGFLRQLALFGAEGRIDQSKVERCARFELDFDSNIADDITEWRGQVRATVPLTFSFTDGPTGEAELLYVSSTFTGSSQCSITSAVLTNSVFSVSRTSINLNVFEGSSAPPQALTMVYDPGHPSFTASIACPGGTSIVPQGELWRANYYDHHSEDVTATSFVARDWDRVGGSVYARRIYQINSGGSVETTTMTLKHIPQ